MTSECRLWIVTIQIDRHQQTRPILMQKNNQVSHLNGQDVLFSGGFLAFFDFVMAALLWVETSSAIWMNCKKNKPNVYHCLQLSVFLVLLHKDDCKINTCRLCKRTGDKKWQNAKDKEDLSVEKDAEPDTRDGWCSIALR